MAVGGGVLGAGGAVHEFAAVGHFVLLPKANGVAGKLRDFRGHRGVGDGGSVEVHGLVHDIGREATSSAIHLASTLQARHRGGRSPFIGPRFHRSAERTSHRVFFRDCRDIARWDVQCQIAEPLGVDIAAVERQIHDGTAFSQLAADYQDADKMRIEGSPSFVLNEGRQKFYGNIGFRLIEANIQELLRSPGANEASWC